MISTKKPLGLACATLPRRDILAICAYLNRKFDPAETRAGSAHPDGVLEKLAAAARMQ